MIESERKLILPSGEDASSVSAALARERRDEEDATRGTNRQLSLLNQRVSRKTGRPKGVVGY